ncbi:hypothetical protein CgunFtcFv8_025913 [Champsocephalus gunnari]|uniref:Uncharacterized protein n=1 Tax=Champsocephalus gunnari TaxID=52237 RepID=A0AAN8CBP8_CHAGU|nr:hypothetical protein CgunFtcFv8_025913 [Champsocephalus gunnari]
MRNRLVEGKEPLEQSGPMGKGKRAKKRRPFLEEDDDVEQSEERPSKKSRLESSSSTDIIQKYKDLQKAQELATDLDAAFGLHTGAVAESNTLLSSSPHRTLTTNTSPDNVCFTHETHSIILYLLV